MAEIPPSFLANSWTLESGEGVDEYFKAKGTPWMIRKLILAWSHITTWSKLEDGRFSVVNKSPVTLTFEFRVGEEFFAKGYDKCERKILITVERDSITERHQKTDMPEDPPEVFTYKIVGGKMIQRMERAEVSCTRVFKNHT